MNIKNKILFSIVALIVTGSMACARNTLTLVNTSTTALKVQFGAPLVDNTTQILIPASATMTVEVGPGWIGAPVDVEWENGRRESIFFVNRDGNDTIASEETTPQSPASPTNSDDGDWSFTRQ